MDLGSRRQSSYTSLPLGPSRQVSRFGHAGMYVSAPFLIGVCLGSLCFAQEAGAGRRQFEAHCVTCHGADANGGEFGPSILTRIPQHTDDDLIALITTGLPGRGMPPSSLSH